jgi:hypothetical protein
MQALFGVSLSVTVTARPAAATTTQIRSADSKPTQCLCIKLILLVVEIWNIVCEVRNVLPRARNVIVAYLIAKQASSYKIANEHITAGVQQSITLQKILWMTVSGSKRFTISFFNA